MQNQNTMEGGSNTFYRTTGVHSNVNELFEIEDKTVTLELTNQEMDFFKANKNVNDLFQHIYDEYIKDAPENLKVRVIIFLPGFFDNPLSSEFISKQQFTLNVILKIIDQAIQSKKPEAYEKIENNLMKIVITFAKLVQGSGLKRPGDSLESSNKRSIIDLEDYCDASRFVTVLENDKLCLIRAIVIAKAHCDREKNAKNLYKNPTKLRKRVYEIVEALDLPLDIPLNLTHVRLVEEHLQVYSIVVYSGGERKQRPVYYNEKNIKKKFLYILHRDDHFDALLKIKSFFKVKFFCEPCQKIYYHSGDHKCEFTCKACGQYGCEEFDVQQCKCKIETRNKTCKQRHLESRCFKKKICNKCNTLRANKSHVCVNQKYCNNCKKSVDYSHTCFILTQDQIDERDVNKRKRDFLGFIFWDSEAYSDTKTGHHIVNLVMAQRICKSCIDKDKKCEFCDQKLIYTNISDFVDFMLSDSCNGYIFIAHNAKGYDNHFVINEFQKRKIPTDTEVRVIAIGTKLIGVYYRGIILKDSSTFIPMRLEDFPKAFNLKELKKGYFPHKFNHPDHFNHVGRWPDKEDYGYDFFSTEKRGAFLKWYKEQENKVFNFKQELEDYCWSDVCLLTQGCLIYSRDSRMCSKRPEEEDGVCPFRERLTLASYCNLIYTRNHMEKNSISMLPACGFSPKANMSRKCELWLKFLSETKKINIKHAKNGGEKKIGQFYVDGFCEEKKIIYEFLGCLWHGCSLCYNEATFNPVTRCLNSTLLTRTLKRAAKIKELMPDYEIVEIWEHEYDEMVKHDLNLSNFVKKHYPNAPLFPRDALFGGRTNAIKLYHLCSSNEKILYIDFTSLYPSVMKYCRYPKGQPTILTENFDPKKSYFGLIKCTIVAPRGIYMPVLPYKCNGKLLFTLCRVCGEMQETSTCMHNEEERAITGTYVTLEVERAIKAGYKVLKTIEIWHFEEYCEYDPITQSGGLFTAYLNDAIKRKQEASGFPDDCKTEQEKNDYIMDYYENEKISLDKDKIEKNAGQRLVAKLWANTLWGYFALNTNRSQFRIINSPAEWQELLQNEQYIITDVYINSNNNIQVTFKENEQMHTGNNKTNVIIAAFVTCHARIKLYNELEKLGRRVLYFDTDSIIYIDRPGEYSPKLGNYLGEFTNEIPAKHGNYIKEFVSGGPKNYGYITDKEWSDITVKGITFNHLASLKIDFNSMKRLVESNPAELITVPQLLFKRDKRHWTLKTTIQDKIYRYVYDKRVVQSEPECDKYTTLPYGY